jgi:hypothetical protein
MIPYTVGLVGNLSTCNASGLEGDKKVVRGQRGLQQLHYFSMMAY